MKKSRVIGRFFKKNACIIVFVMIIFLLTFAFSHIVAVSASGYNGITIVLDAGHGGRDGGSVGVNGTIEKEINLRYTLALKEKLVSAGYRVELTRKTDDGLYLESAKNKKMSDLNARMEIIKRANPNLVISIHMNSFSSPSAHGASTYYRSGDESGQIVSDLIQQSLNTYLGAPSTKGKVGDYYILNESYYTAVLIECGFLSNPEEERLLNTDEYLEKFVGAVYNAILLYFG